MLSLHTVRNHPGRPSPASTGSPYRPSWGMRQRIGQRLSTAAWPCIGHNRTTKVLEKAMVIALHRRLLHEHRSASQSTNSWRIRAEPHLTLLRARLMPSSRDSCPRQTVIGCKRQHSSVDEVGSSRTARGSDLWIVGADPGLLPRRHRPLPDLPSRRRLKTEKDAHDAATS